MAPAQGHRGMMTNIIFIGLPMAQTRDRRSFIASYFWYLDTVPNQSLETILSRFKALWTLLEVSENVWRRLSTFWPERDYDWFFQYPAREVLTLALCLAAVEKVRRCARQSCGLDVLVKLQKFGEVN